MPATKVSLFITCLTDLFQPHVGIATVNVLEHFGCIVDFPAAQTCCGQPQFNNGYADQTRHLAQRMMRVFKNSPFVVTPSGSCCAMFREHYPALFRDDPQWEEEALALAAKTYEFVEFLTKILKVDLAGLKLPAPKTLTYHYNCHLRGLHLTGDSCTRVIQSMEGATFVPLNKADQCCGFGGTFAVKYPDISGAIVKDKIENAARTGADILIVNDAGCSMNISGACHRNNQPIAVKHIAEILSEAIELKMATDGH